MGYTLWESGRTGPSANIGGSSDYHIDSKFSTSLGEDEARRRFEAKVRKYRELNRNVEFSNEGVAGMVYNLDASEEERAEMFRKAYGAHSKRDGWYSLDYYAPKTGENRFGKSAEGAPIFAVGGEGSRRETGTGGNYGFYSFIYDKNGNIISKVGHGDDRYTTVPNNPMSPDPSSPSPTADVETKPASTSNDNMSPEEINKKYDQMRMAGDALGAREFGLAQNKRLFG